MKISRSIAILFFVVLLIIGVIFGLVFSGVSSVLSMSGQGNMPDPQTIQASLNGLINKLYFASLAAVLLIGTASWLLLRSIRMAFARLESVLSLTTNDLDFTHQAKSDGNRETYPVISAYNGLLDRLCHSFVEIQGSLERLLETTEEVDLAARRISRNSQTQSDASKHVATAVEEMSISLTTVAGQTTEANQHTHDAYAIAQQSATSIHETVTDIQQIAEIVRQAVGCIKSLSTDCNSISSVAQMIHEIADQTNLLALNAAIEAARAGEQGRGFAVVADEVRKLAERTTLSTQEINDLLKRVQSGAQKAVEDMNLTEKVVTKSVLHVREAGVSIEKLRSGAEASANIVAEISNAMREQESASATIAHNIEQIAHMSEQNATAASSAAESVEKMSRLGSEMAELLSAYKLETREKRVVLRLADTHGEDHPVVKATQAMAKILAERSNGRICLKVFPGGAFGVEKDELEQVRVGTLDMTRANSAMLNKLCPLTIVPGLPFLFNSTAHMQRALDGAPGQEILASCADAGFVGLAFYDSGTRSIYANQPVRSVNDVRGMRLRVQQSDLWVAIAEAMGAKATPMAMQDLVMGQRTGLVDAAENNLSSYDGGRHYEAFRYFCRTEHSMAPEILVMSKKRWDTLSAEDRTLLTEAARESVAIMRNFWQAREDLAYKNAQTAGTVFVDDVDKTSFQNAMKPVYQRFITNPQQKALFNAIKAIK